MNSPLRVALVADWLTNYAGAETVIEALTEIFPSAPLFTTVFVPEKMKKIGAHPDVRPSYLQKLPKFLRVRHPALIAFLPRAIESLDLTGYDIVISSSCYVGKGVITPPEALHVCYCHTPARFLWGDWQDFLKKYPLPRWLKFFLPPLLSRLRVWDRLSAERPDLYIANSDFIAARIKKFWRRDALVLSPPVNLEKIPFVKNPRKGDYFLSAGRLVAQKGLDFLIDTFKALPEYKLKIAGCGHLEKALKERAEGAANIEFLGYVSDEKLATLFAEAKATIFPHVEDAGIVPLESLAAGTPVIALAKGGALTTLNSEVAVLFPEQTLADFQKALQEFAAKTFDRQKLRAHAEEFSLKNFQRQFKKIVEGEWQKRHQQ